MPIVKCSVSFRSMESRAYLIVYLFFKALHLHQPSLRKFKRQPSIQKKKKNVNCGCLIPSRARQQHTTKPPRTSCIPTPVSRQHDKRSYHIFCICPPAQLLSAPTYIHATTKKIVLTRYYRTAATPISAKNIIQNKTCTYSTVRKQKKSVSFLSIIVAFLRVSPCLVVIFYICGNPRQEKKKNLQALY